MTKRLTSILFIVIFFNVSLKGMATTSTMPLDTLPPEDIFVIVEKMPTFPNGETAMNQYIKDNLQYPAEAKAANIQGTVYVKFVVLKDGSLYDIKIVRGVANGFGVNKEALRLVQSMPKWNPGTQRGVPVPVYFTLPIRFKMGLPLKPEPVKPTKTTKHQKRMIQSKQLVPMNKRAKELKSKQKIKMNMQITPKHPSTKAPDIVEGEGIELDYVGADGIPVYKTVPEMPYYGESELEVFKLIAKNLRYPVEAIKSNIQGTVYVSFVVMEGGELTKIHLKKGIAGGEMCDEEALRVIRSLPKWNSGKIAGDAVRVSMVLPLRFTLIGGAKNKKRRNKRKK